MGWKSTLNITKQDIIIEIMSRIFKATDEQLEEVLEDLTPKVPYNFTIVPAYDNKSDRNYHLGILD